MNDFLGLSAAQAKRYSLSAAFLSAEKNNRENSLEREISGEIAKHLGRPVGQHSVYIPVALNPVMLGLDTRTNADGKFTVATRIPDILDALRAQTRVLQLGATVLDGLRSNIQLATEATPTSAVWSAENPGADNAENNPAFGARTMSPKTLTASTTASRQLLAQSSGLVDEYLRRSIAKSHAIAIDSAAINGTGSSNQPLGLLNTSGIGNVSAGGPASYAHLLGLEDAVGGSNADYESNGFLACSAQRKKLRQVAVNDTGSKMCWTVEDGVDECIGRPAAVSANCPSTAIIHGAWQYLVVALWGGLELIVDPFSLKKQGLTQFTSVAFVDIGVEHPEAFAAIQDAS